MASEVVYAEVAPKEREHLTSQTSDTGDPTTYAEVKVKRRPDRAGSTPRTIHTACLKNSRWCYVVFALCFIAIILLIVVILSAVKCHAL